MRYTVNMVSDAMIYTQFHVDWLWHSGNIKVIFSTASEVVVLVLLMAEISYACH
jgi:hypothetical protein